MSSDIEDNIKEERLATNIVIELLESWGVSLETQEVFKAQDIDLTCLQNIKKEDIQALIPSTKIKDRIKFRSGLEEYKKENNLITTASFETESIKSSDLEITSISCEPPKRKEIVLKEVLASNSAGQLCLATYKLSQKLNSCSRSNLVKSVVDFYLKEQGCMNRYDFEKITAQIIKWCPTEHKETYYIPCQKFAKGKYIPARGKLVDRYNNQKRVLRSIGILSSPKSQKEINPQNIKDNENCDDCEEQTINFEGCKIWLKFNKEPIEELMKKWRETSKIRLRQLHSEDQNLTLNDILNDWPSLNLSFGYKLIELDFRSLYPNRTIELFKKWPDFIKKSLPIYHNIKTTERYLNTLNENTNEDTRDYIHLLLICYKVLPTIKISINDNGKKKTYRPTIVESLNAFILLVKNQIEIDENIKRKREELFAKGLTHQPFLVVVGPQIENLQHFYVCFDNVKYKTDSILKAVDICFKVFHVLNISYPIEAIH